MSKIFISHSSHDNAKALAVAQWLEQNGWADYFLDITPSRGIAPGERWQAALKAAQDRCEAVLFLISPAWRDSKWCLAEFLQVKQQVCKPIFGVMIEATPLDSLPKEMTAEWQLCDLVTGEERQHFRVAQDQIVPLTDVSLSGAGLAKLKQGLHKTGLDPSFFPWPPPNDPDRLPYRGLKALEAEDAAVFFGREAPLIRALDTLRRMEESGEQLFVILGASGAGKSSFLRAGLWPRLKRDDRHFLPLPVIRPERAAITGQSGLVESLEKTFREYKVPKTRADLRAILAKPEGIVELLTEIQTNAQKRLGPGATPPTLVIGLDQAEELFAKEGTDEAGQLLDCFSQLLGQVAQDRQSVSTPMPRVMVLAAIRSDSYEQMQSAQKLSGIRQTPFSLPPLAPAEYKMVIEGPAARATEVGRKLAIEPALTEQLLKDAEGADALPMLAFILERSLIDYGADGDLLLKEYEALGGLQGSIEAAVREAWKDPGRDPVIPADEATRHTLLHQVFALLVTIEENSVTPRRLVAAWSDLPMETQPLLERLVEARLLLKDRRKLADGQEAVVVEVTHEALLRQWKVLGDWIKDERDDLVEAARLKREAELWAVNGKKEEWLRRGERLNVGETLVGKPAYRGKLKSVNEFLAVSRKEEEFRAKERAEQIKRARKFLMDPIADRKKISQSVWADMAKLIATLEVSDQSKEFLRTRWLEQVLWMEDMAWRASRMYYQLRFATIIGGFISPTLVALNVGDTTQFGIPMSTFVISLVVGLSAAAEEFVRQGDPRRHRMRVATIILGLMVPVLISLSVGSFENPLVATLGFVVSLVVVLSAAGEEVGGYGRRWRQAQRAAESLKREGWQFFQLSGPYANQTHAQAYPTFAARVEELSAEEAETFTSARWI